MRLLHTADWHLGRTLEGRSRLEEQAQFLDELVKIVEKEKVDAILMAGDAFDTVNPPAAAERLFYDSLARLSNKGRRPIVVISGNHDNPERLQAASPLSTQQNIFLVGSPRLDVLTIPIISSDELLRVAPLSYPSESRLLELLSETNDEALLQSHYNEKVKAMFAKMSESFTKDAVNVAMSHIFVAGGASTDSERPIEVGGAYTVAAPSLPSSAQYVALGHLHRPQNMRGAGTLVRYSGSPLAYSFSEAGYAKSVTVVDVAPGQEAALTEIYLSSGKPLVKWKCTEGIDQVYRWLDEGKDGNAWIDLEIHMTHALSMEEIHHIRKAHSGILHIRPVFKEEVRETIHVKYTEVPIGEHFERFFERQMNGAKPEKELVQLFLELVKDEEAEGEQE